ncbi:hypothetical protein FJ365_00685 [Candidatus Dependentiae bacterium]|nr:hypothetical protein [Candidatus Dependentiae bacterium]
MVPGMTVPVIQALIMSMVMSSGESYASTPACCGSRNRGRCGTVAAASDAPLRYGDWLSQWITAGHNIFSFTNTSGAVVGLRAGVNADYGFAGDVVVAAWPGKTIMVPSFIFRKKRNLAGEEVSCDPDKKTSRADIELCTMPEPNGVWESLPKEDAAYSSLRDIDLAADCGGYCLSNKTEGMLRIVSSPSEAVAWCAPDVSLVIPPSGLGEFFYVQQLASYVYEGHRNDDPQCDTILGQSKIEQRFPVGAADVAAWERRPAEDAEYRDYMMLSHYVATVEDVGVAGEQRLELHHTTYSFRESLSRARK